MKIFNKIFLIILLLSGIIYSQTVIPKDKIHYKIPGDGSNGKFSIMAYYNPSTSQYYYYEPTAIGTISLPDSTALQISDLESSINILRSYFHPSERYGGDDSVTVTTETDTIRAPTNTTTWWKIDITNISSSINLEWSFDAGWSWQREILPTMSFYTEVALSVTSVVVVRRRSASGTGLYDYITFGY